MKLYDRVTEGQLISSLFFRVSRGGGIQIAWHDRILGARILRQHPGRVTITLLALPATEPCPCGVGRRSADRRLDEQCAICELDLRPPLWWQRPRIHDVDAHIEQLHAEVADAHGSP